jgi:hypothetical protein
VFSQTTYSVTTYALHTFGFGASFVVCKTSIGGSNPPGASRRCKPRPSPGFFVFEGLGFVAVSRPSLLLIPRLSYRIREP